MARPAMSQVGSRLPVSIPPLTAPPSPDGKRKSNDNSKAGTPIAAAKTPTPRRFVVLRQAWLCLRTGPFYRPWTSVYCVLALVAPPEKGAVARPLLCVYPSKSRVDPDVCLAAIPKNAASSSSPTGSQKDGACCNLNSSFSLKRLGSSMRQLSRLGRSSYELRYSNSSVFHKNGFSTSSTTLGLTDSSTVISAQQCKPLAVIPLLSLTNTPDFSWMNTSSPIDYVDYIVKVDIPKQASIHSSSSTANVSSHSLTSVPSSSGLVRRHPFEKPTLAPFVLYRGSKTKYHLAAHSPSERDEWVNAISGILASLPQFYAHGLRKRVASPAVERRNEHEETVPEQSALKSCSESINTVLASSSGNPPPEFDVQTRRSVFIDHYPIPSVATFGGQPFESLCIFDTTVLTASGLNDLCDLFPTSEQRNSTVPMRYVSMLPRNARKLPAAPTDPWNDTYQILILPPEEEKMYLQGLSPILPKNCNNSVARDYAIRDIRTCEFLGDFRNVAVSLCQKIVDDHQQALRNQMPLGQPGQPTYTWTFGNLIIYMCTDYSTASPANIESSTRKSALELLTINALNNPPISAANGSLSSRTDADMNLPIDHNTMSKLNLRTTLMCIVDYKGFRLVCYAAMPLDNKSTKVVDLSSRQAHVDQPALTKMNIACSRLNLRSHRVYLRSKDPQAFVVTNSSSTIDIHYSRTHNHYYVLNLCELFPFDQVSRESFSSSPGIMPLPSPTRRLRPEFLLSLKSPLSADAFMPCSRPPHIDCLYTKSGYSTPSTPSSKIEVLPALVPLPDGSSCGTPTTHSASTSAYTLSAKSNTSFLTASPQVSVTERQECLASNNSSIQRNYQEQAESTSQSAVVDRATLERNYAQAVQEADICDSETVLASRLLRDATVPALVRRLDSLSIQPRDGAELVAYMHESGINVRYLGLIAGNTTLPHIRDLCLTEILARAAKTLHSALIRNSLLNFRRIEATKTDSELIRLSVEFFNALLSASSLMWEDLRSIVYHKFKYIISKDQMQALHRPALFLRAQEQCGVRFDDRCDYVFSEPNPLAAADFVSFETRVKNVDPPRNPAISYYHALGAEMSDEKWLLHQLARHLAVLGPRAKLAKCNRTTAEWLGRLASHYVAVGRVFDAVKIGMAASLTAPQNHIVVVPIYLMLSTAFAILQKSALDGDMTSKAMLNFKPTKLSDEELSNQQQPTQDSPHENLNRSSKPATDSANANEQNETPRYIEYLRRAANVVNFVYGTDHPAMIEVRYHAAKVLTFMERPQKALKSLLEARRLSERVIGRTHDHTRRIALAIANLQMLMNNHADCATTLSEYLSVFGSAWPLPRNAAAAAAAAAAADAAAAAAAAVAASAVAAAEAAMREAEQANKSGKSTENESVCADSSKVDTFGVLRSICSDSKVNCNNDEKVCKCVDKTKCECPQNSRNHRSAAAAAAAATVAQAAAEAAAAAAASASGNQSPHGFNKSALYSDSETASALVQAQAQAMLARSLFCTGDLQGAKRSAHVALNIREKVVGKNHELTCDSNVQLAQIEVALALGLDEAMSGQWDGNNGGDPNSLLFQPGAHMSVLTATMRESINNAVECYQRVFLYHKQMHLASGSQNSNTNVQADSNRSTQPQLSTYANSNNVALEGPAQQCRTGGIALSRWWPTASNNVAVVDNPSIYYVPNVEGNLVIHPYLTNCQNGARSRLLLEIARRILVLKSMVLPGEHASHVRRSQGTVGSPESGPKSTMVRDIIIKLVRLTPCVFFEGCLAEVDSGEPGALEELGVLVHLMYGSTTSPKNQSPQNTNQQGQAVRA